MEDADVVKLLQHYRHDLMNRLQIVQGYISMNKTDKAEKKLKEMIKHYEKERKLINLKAPSYTLWLMQVNSMFSHIKLEYDIQTEKNLHHAEDELTVKCRKIINAVNEICDNEELIDISTLLKDTEESSFVEVSFLVYGKNNEERLLTEKLHDEQVNVSHTPEGLVFSFLIK